MAENPDPVIVTLVPFGPEAGVNDVINGAITAWLTWFSILEEVEYPKLENTNISISMIFFRAIWIINFIWKATTNLQNKGSK